MNRNGEISEGVLLTSEDQLDGDTAEELASFIDDMNSTEHADAYITVLRIPTDSRGTPLPNSKHAGQLFHELLGRSTVNDVIERIRAGYIPPGETKITVRILGKRPGDRKLLFNRIYTIEKPYHEEKRSGETTVGEMMRLMREHADAQAQRTENFMREMLSMQSAARVAPADNLVDQLVKLSPILTPVLSALIGRPPVPAGNGAADLLATVRTLKEASNLFGGGKGEGDDTMSTVKAVAEAVGPGLKFLAARAETDRMTAAERIRRLPPPPAPTPAPPPAAKTPPGPRPKPNPKPPKASPNNSTPEVEDMKLNEMREQLATLAQLCDEGQSPKAVAELIVDNCEDDQLEELYQRVEPVNAVAQMAVLAPTAVRGREKWFGELRTEILAQYEDDPDAVPVNGSGGESADDLGASPVDVDEIPDVTN